MVLSLSVLLSFLSTEHKVISPSVFKLENKGIRDSWTCSWTLMARRHRPLKSIYELLLNSWTFKSNEIQIILYFNSARPQMANLDSFSTGQVTIADPKYVLFESNSRNSQRKCSERPPENVKHEFKRNHFHICLFLRFRRLILIVQEHQTISMKFDDVIKFQRKGLTNRL